MTSTKPLGTHTHNTVAAIEDLTAVSLDAKTEIDIALQRLVQRRDEEAYAGAEYALLYTMVRLTKMLEILNTLRRGPYAYDKDTAQNYPEIKRE